MKNFLILTPDLNKPGGVANYYNSIAEHIPHNILYFAVGNRKIEKGKIKKIKRLLNDYRDFKKIIDTNSIELLVANPSLDYSSLLRDRFFLNYARKKKIKTITFFRGWSTKLGNALTNRKFLINPFLKSDAIITLAEESKLQLQYLGCKSKIFLETTTVADKLLQQSKKIEKKNFTILFLARLEVEKGIYEAIETFQILNQKYPFIKMIMGGEGSEYKRLVEFVTKYNISNIELPGYLKGESKIRAFNESDIYFFPSYHNEGMPNSVLEAMAFGLPIITRGTGGLNDFFENEKMGFLTQSKDPTTFSTLIEHFITDPKYKETVGAFNSDYAKKRFLSSVVSKRILNIFESVILSNTPDNKIRKFQNIILNASCNNSGGNI
jgi:glycosyltransferase involved in cell wall biosynthesis